MSPGVRQDALERRRKAWPSAGRERDSSTPGRRLLMLDTGWDKDYSGKHKTMRGGGGYERTS